MYQIDGRGRRALERLSLPLAFFQNIDGQNIPILVSDGFCNMLGINREQMMEEQRWSKFDRIHPEDVGRTQQAVREFWDKKSNYDVLYRVRYADNTYHFIHSVAFWWPMEDGMVKLPNGEVVEGKLNSWLDFDDSDVIQVKIDGKTYLTSYVNVCLIDD